MQQLNILPINVSQNVDVKDDYSVLNSTSSKDDFSQHIDLHLAKNKEVINDEKLVVDEKSDANTVKELHEQSNKKVDGKSQQSTEAELTSTDETDSANNTQEIAASGKKSEKALSAEKLGEEDQVVDESELLMSFLMKADKILVKGNSTENSKLNEMSAEQKAKYEAQLLLKSSGLVADLSGVAKALNPSVDDALEVLSESGQSAKALLGAAKNTKTNANQLNDKTLIEGESLDTEGSATESVGKLNPNMEGKAVNGNSVLNEKYALSQHKLGGESTTNIEDENKKVAETTQKSGIEQLARNELGGKVSSEINEGSDDVAQKLIQKESAQQGVMPESKNGESSNIKLTPKSAVGEQVIANVQNPLEVDAKINDKIAQLIQSKNGIENTEGGLASTIAASQNTRNDKNLSGIKLNQTSASIPVKQGDLVEPEAQLNAKSVEHLIEQGKEFNLDDTKEISHKVFSKTSADVSINSNFAEMTGRAAQTTQNIADQHVADVFNPIGSSEVSQSQKTNAQLHHETIAIFRKDFSDAVKDKVMIMISQKLQQFDITLDPPELGNMQVRVNLQGEQATVNFVVQNQQAKEALEQNMHKLKELLAEQGVDVGDANVEQQSQQSGNDANNDENSGDNHHSSVTNTAIASDAIEHNLSASMFNSSVTSVDYYA